MDPVGRTYLNSLQIIRVGSYGYILLRDTRPTIKVQGTEDNIRDYNIEDWPRLQAWESYILGAGTLQATPSLQSRIFLLVYREIFIEKEWFFEILLI